MSKYKTVFSLRIRQYLRECGVEPLYETKNFNKPEYQCWVYEATDEMLKYFDEGVRLYGSSESKNYNNTQSRS